MTDRTFNNGAQKGAVRANLNAVIAEADALLDAGHTAAGLTAALAGKQAAGSYATAAQGSLAETAVQPGALGTAAAQDASAFAEAGHGHGVATTSAPGFLPQLPGGTTAFLRADGTFAAPPAGEGGGGGGNWGEIGGNLGDQTDLSQALAGKASTSALSDHIADTGNPHSVTAAAVGLGNVDNTSDAAKPISSATQAALNAKLDTTDASVTNSREWTADTITQATAEAGTATARVAWTAQRVRQAILGWWNGSAEKTKLDGIAAGATANATDAQLRDRGTHTGAQAISTVTGLQSALDGKATAAQGALADTAVQPAALDPMVRWHNADGSASSARPSVAAGAMVIWINSPTEPANMGDFDLWADGL